MEKNNYDINYWDSNTFLGESLILDVPKIKLNELKSDIEKKYISLYRDKAIEIKKFLDLVFSDRLSGELGIFNLKEFTKKDNKKGLNTYEKDNFIKLLDQAVLELNLVWSYNDFEKQFNPAWDNSLLIKNNFKNLAQRYDFNNIHIPWWVWYVNATNKIFDYANWQLSNLTNISEEELYKMREEKFDITSFEKMGNFGLLLWIEVGEWLQNMLKLILNLWSGYILSPIYINNKTKISWKLDTEDEAKAKIENDILLKNNSSLWIIEIATNWPEILKILWEKMKSGKNWDVVTYLVSIAWLVAWWAWIIKTIWNATKPTNELVILADKVGKVANKVDDTISTGWANKVIWKINIETTPIGIKEDGMLTPQKLDDKSMEDLESYYKQLDEWTLPELENLFDANNFEIVRKNYEKLHKDDVKIEPTNPIVSLEDLTKEMGNFNGKQPTKKWLKENWGSLWVTVWAGILIWTTIYYMNKDGNITTKEKPGVIDDVPPASKTQKPGIIEDVPPTDKTQKPEVIKKIPIIIKAEKTKVIKKAPTIIKTEKTKVIKKAPTIIKTEKTKVIKKTPTIIKTEKTKVIKKTPTIIKAEKAKVIKDTTTPIIKAEKNKVIKDSHNIDKKTKITEYNFSTVDKIKDSLVKQNIDLDKIKDSELEVVIAYNWGHLRFRNQDEKIIWKLKLWEKLTYLNEYKTIDNHIFVKTKTKQWNEWWISADYVKLAVK